MQASDRAAVWEHDLETSGLDRLIDYARQLGSPDSTGRRAPEAREAREDATPARARATDGVRVSLSATARGSADPTSAKASTESSRRGERVPFAGTQGAPSVDPGSRRGRVVAAYLQNQASESGRRLDRKA